jgi:hypothetical protein
MAINQLVPPRHQIQTDPKLMNAMGPARPTLAAPTEDLSLGYDAENKFNQQEALLDLQKRYAAVRNPTPRDSSESFWKWLADFGIGVSDANLRGIQSGRNPSGLSLLGAGAANSAKGYFNKVKDAEKLKALQLGNLGGEMNLLTAMGKLGDAKEWSVERKEANGYHAKDRVYSVPGTKVPKVVKFKPKPVYLQNKDTLETKTVDASEGKELRKLQKEGWSRTSLPAPKQKTTISEITPELIKENPELRRFAANAGQGQTPMFDSKTGKRWYESAKVTEAWQPLSGASDAIKKAYGPVPQGTNPMYDANAKGKPSFKSSNLPAPVEKLWVSNDGIAEPRAVDMRNPAEVAKAKKDGLVPAPAGASEVPKGKRAGWMANMQDIKFGRNRIKDLVTIFDKDPSKGGVVGSVKEIIQEGKGMAGELSAWATGYHKEARRHVAMGRHEADGNEKIAQLFRSKQKAQPGEAGFDEELAIVNQVTASLIYAVALSNKTSGRLNRQDIERAEIQVKTRGMVTGKKVMAQLKKMDQMMGERQTLTQELLDGKVGKPKAPTGGPPKDFTGKKYKWVGNKLVEDK